MSKAYSESVSPGWERARFAGPRRSEAEGYLKRLIAAGSRASTLGIAVLDSQTRFQLVNTALSRETRATPDQHVGKTSSEIVGELARQIEPTYENVLRTGKPDSVLLTGNVRDTPEFGYWFDYCFPIFDRAQRVQQLGVFVVNVTAEKAAREILDTLTIDPKQLQATGAGLLETFDAAIWNYHSAMCLSLEQLASPSTEPARKAEDFRSSIELIDTEISQMRELIYALISHLSIPKC
jgi:hypothetical protein